MGKITRKILLNYELNLNESFLRSPVAQRTIFRNRNSLKEKKSLGKIVNHGKKIILSSFLSWRKFTTEPQLHVLNPAFLASVKTYPLLINYVHHVFIRASETWTNCGLIWISETNYRTYVPWLKAFSGEPHVTSSRRTV